MFLQLSDGADGGSAQTSRLQHTQAAAAAERVRVDASVSGDGAETSSRQTGQGHRETAQVRQTDAERTECCVEEPLVSYREEHIDQLSNMMKSRGNMSFFFSACVLFASINIDKLWI